jgi:hypothetical protein
MSGDYAPAEDEELKEFGGQFDKKIAVWQVTIRLPLDMNPLNLLAILYGFLPFIIPGAMGLSFLYTWHFIYLYGVIISLVLVTINEGGLKKACNQPRPSRSANKNPDGTLKHGMPSGHVLNSTSLFVWSFLEVYLRGPGLVDEQKLTYTWLGAITVLMLPVPWARWYNGDHSTAQCAVSIILGICVGFGAFYCRMHYFSPAWKPWSHEADADWAHHKPLVTFYRPPWVATTAEPHHARNLMIVN